MESLKSIIQKLHDGQAKLKLSGLGTSAKAFILSTLCAKTQRSALVLTAHQEGAEQLSADLEFFLRIQGCGIPVVLFPAIDVHTTWSTALQRELTGQRMKALFTIQQEKQSILIAPLMASLQPIPSLDWLKQSVRTLRKGDSINQDAFITKLIELGYQRVGTVEQPGEFAVRGGIIDVYHLSSDQPVRLELMGDSLESLRLFDSITQKSSVSIEEIIILPSIEENVSACVSDSYLDQLSSYMPVDRLTVLDEPELLIEKAKDHQEQTGQNFSGLSIQGDQGPQPSQIIELRTLDLERSEQRPVGGMAFETQSPSGMGLGVKATPFTQTINQLRALCKQFYIVIVCRSHDQQKRFQEILMEHEIPATRCEGLTLPVKVTSNLQLTVGHLSSGFFLKDLNLGFITEEELFGKSAAHPVKRARLRPFLTSFEDLKFSDHVVHLHYGIGKFLGLQRLAINGFEAEFLVIQYAGGDKIYVPLDHLNLVQKYIGSEGSVPRLDRLGTATWTRTKQKVKREIHRMAKDLLELYASREVARGFAFSPDGLLSKEFDATFEYEETPDQIRAIQEVKADMELPRPMDRVVCGDVGYGKTEVALRATFKAILDNKQVALLVPTTLLAQQHYQTFSRRFSAFPIRVEVLSRFRTPREQKTVIRDLAQGKVDVVIGTHRLLQKDIVFRDLGLVIVDEEQRFGVAHKERFKLLRKTVDVLTLTATPIPRTLQMALLGTRDLSTIETPPPDRLAVKTVVTRFDKQLIRDAILRELQRGGQVFFVHNRVKSIQGMAQFLSQMVPGIRIGIAHGQMREKDLERVMLKFLSKEYNLLLTTAIIESGLDIPTVNTIMVNRADQFGLADLYQLRGRVGRSGIQAYAYLLVPDQAVLTEDAKKRLTALQEFSELGAGFKIALRDLEIRGAGNLLGPEQSGHVAAIGFELYLQMIQQTVRELKGQAPEEEIEPSLSLKVSAYLPEDYIPDTYQRLVIYKRLASLKELEELSGIREELIDRFGPPSKPVECLMQIIQLKILSRHLKILQVESKPDAIVLAFHPSAVIPEGALQLLLKKYGQRLRFLSGYSLQLRSPGDQWDNTFTTLWTLLQELWQIQKNHRAG